METNVIMNGDALTHLKELPSESINCIMTSPPYWALRDYGIEGQIGLEPTFQEYIKHLCDIFDEVKRVLRKDGTCWVNLGDTYSGSHSMGSAEDYMMGLQKNLKFNFPKDKKPNSNIKGFEGKNLCNIPARFSVEMQNRGWILRNVIIWHKPNCMPSSVDDRFTVDFEYIFFFVKNKKYWFETQREKAVVGYNDLDFKPTSLKDNFDHNLKTAATGASMKREDKYVETRNKRTVWSICPKPFKEAHFAVYPEEICETPIKAGCPVGGIVLDPFFGAGTTGLVALKQNKQFIGIELNPEYIKIAEERLRPLLEQSKL